MKKLFTFFSFALSPRFLPIYLFHILNDGSKSSFLLLLPYITNDLHLTLTQAGFLATLLNLLGIMLALPAGYIATKFGGLKTLVIALFFYGLGFLGISLSPTYLWLFPLFILAGVGFGLFHPIGLALVARLAEKTERGKQMGNFTAVGDLGRIGIAAVLTFIVVFLGWRTTSLFYAVIVLGIATFFSLFFLPKHEHFVAKGKKSVELKLLTIIRHKQFLFATLSFFCDNFASTSLFIFLPFLLLAKDINPALLGSFVALYFIGNFAGKTILGRFVDIFGAARVFIISEFLMAFFIFLLATTAFFPMIIICSLVLGIFAKGTSPVLHTMISESAEHHGNFEKSFGANQLTGTIANTITPVILGFVSDKLGITSAFYLMAGFALLAIIPAVGFHLSKDQA